MLRPFIQLDVFSSVPLAGNPLAVVLDANGLDESAMQRFARWTNLSETTFVLAPTSTQASYRVRIFTPMAELPFAGHPSVGTAWALLDAGLVKPKDDCLIQECGAGFLEVRHHDRFGIGLSLGARELHLTGSPEAQQLVPAGFRLELRFLVEGKFLLETFLALVESGHISVP